MSRRFIIAVLVVFYAGYITVILLTPDPYVRAYAVAGSTVLAVVVGAPFSWLIAPRLRSRFLREHPHRPLD
jgi:uncharacterized membrane protein YccC